MPTNEIFDRPRKLEGEPLTTEGLPPSRRFKREGFAGLVVLIVGLAVLYIVPTASLSCDRAPSSTPACELEWRILFELIPVRTAHVPGLLEVHVDELIAKHSRKQARNYQAILDTDRGRVRLNMSGNREPVEATVAEIRSYLESRERRRLSLKLESAWPALRWIGTGLVLLGLIYLIPLPVFLYQMLRGTNAPAAGRRELRARTGSSPRSEPSER